MTCSRCGASMPDGSAYCTNCGAPLEAAGAAPATVGNPTIVERRERPWLVTLLGVIKFIQAPILLLGAVVFAVTAGAAHSAIPMAIAVVLMVMGVAAAACGVGLMRLAPYGRYLQIALSIVGLLEIPVQTIISALILVYMFQRGARILFSRAPVDQLSPEDAAALRRAQQPNAAALAVAVSACALLFVAWLGVLAAIAIPNFLNALDRGKQKRTLIDMRSIGTAIESYAVEHGTYPATDKILDLREMLQPKYIKSMPANDGWGHPFRVEASATSYTVWSTGKDGQGSDCEPAITLRFNDEICFVKGQFVRYPSGAQH